MKKIKFDFKNIDTVVGVCEDCGEDTVLLSVLTDYYRCTNCGTDTKQYVNGRIRYMQLTEADKNWLRENRG